MYYVYVVYNPYSYSELSTFVLFILSQDKPAEVHLLILYFNLHLNTSFYHILFVIITKLCLDHKSQIYSLCHIFKHIVLLQTSKSTTSRKLWLSRHIKNLKKNLYQGSADCGEGDQDSDLNCLDKMIVRKYNNVTNQCYRLPWILTWPIQYCACWYTTENSPGMVLTVMC